MDDPDSRPRIGVVSAHYPPNFVSGGTLVPQRLAEGLAGNGYEAAVFAGWIGDERPPLSICDEDRGGVRVRWLTTFHGWSDRRNFDHPEAAEAFGAWLDQFRPQLVHFHSLQTLGAGLVGEAARRKIATVVTLHDFWWWCARQFLCNRHYHPCCLAVDAGTCPCEVDRPFLDDRNRFTVAELERADRIVAVSQSCAEVALANGVDPDRLTVIENGVPSPLTAAATRRRQRGTEKGPLRFVYAGGSDRMKGVQVLIEAARRLPSEPAWELSAYGCEEWAAEVAGLPIQLPPAYRPDRLDDVLAAADVLVVPSVMRETYSILTREALGAGIPVICTASLGPEEVVRHGQNGLVVPAADPEALATSMADVLTKPDLLRHLRANCRAVALPTIGDQMTAHLELYQRTLAARRATPGNQGGATRDIRRVLFVVGIDGAPLRYRARLPAEGLEAAGVHVDVRHYRHPDISALGEQADAVVMYRVPATIQVEHFIAGVRRLGTPVLFDVDDLIFDPDLAAEIPALQILPPEEAALWMRGVSRYRTTMEACDAFVGSTAMLCQHAEAVAGLPAHVFPNGVGRRVGQLSDDATRRPRSPGPLRVGYLSGTKTHDHDWRLIEPALAVLLGDRTDVEIWLVGLIQPTPALAPFADRIHCQPMLPWTELPSLLRDLDVNLAPMTLPSRFNEAKSAIKWMEAALVETPTVASPTQPFRDAVNSGDNGILAANDEEWTEAVSALLDDPLLRRRLGERARRDALLRLAPERQGRRYLHILRSVAPRPLTASDWTPVTGDEPFMVVDLEPYDAEPFPPRLAGPRVQRPTALVRQLRSALRRRAGDLRRYLREEGIAASARRTLRYVRRGGRQLTGRRPGRGTGRER